jgi:hypothetical protein
MANAHLSYDRGRNHLTKLGKTTGLSFRHLITIVHPRTYRGWITEASVGKPKRKINYPKTLESIREIAY